MTKGTRLPEDWKITPEMFDWAMDEAKHLSPMEIIKLSYEFKDHWIAKTGKDATKLNWFATWRNWVRRDMKWNKPKSTVSEANKRAAEEYLKKRGNTYENE